MKAIDYAPFARGQRVLLQLKGPLCMASNGPDGIGIMQAPEAPRAQWVAMLERAHTEQTGKPPTDAELATLLAENPPPMKPMAIPVLVGTLEVKGELLVVHYDYDDEQGKKVKLGASIDPNDIKHVTMLESGLLVET